MRQLNYSEVLKSLSYESLREIWAKTRGRDKDTNDLILQEVINRSEKGESIDGQPERRRNKR